jgi:hypothetical protein
MTATLLPELTSPRRAAHLSDRALVRLAVAAILAASPVGARAECVGMTNSVPVAGVSAGGATPLRAAMLRASAVPAPGVVSDRLARSHVSTPKAKAARKASARRSPKGKAHVRRASRSAPAAATASPIINPPPASAPVAAARPLGASPTTYTLIHTTICETGPGMIPAIPLDTAPRAAMARAPLGEPQIGLTPQIQPTQPEWALPVVFTPPFPPSTISPVAPIPEPNTWALLIMGFAWIGGMLRAQRARAVREPGA